MSVESVPSHGSGHTERPLVTSVESNQNVESKRKKKMELRIFLNVQSNVLRSRC